MIIAGATALCMDGARRVIEDSGIVVVGGRIAAVGELAAVRAEYGAATREIDGRGAVVVPGFVNAHTHGCMTFGRTLGFDRTFRQWLEDSQLPVMEAMNLSDVGLAARVCFAENLLEGNTTVAENSFFPTRVRAEGSPEAETVAAAAEIGCRLVLATSYVTDHYDHRLLERPEDVVARMELALTSWRNELVEVSPSVLLPWATDAVTFQTVAGLASRHGARLHLHTAETPYYNTACQDVHGARSNVGFLSDLDVLDRRSLLVGCSELDEQDLALVAESGATVVSVPTANLFQSHRLVDLLALQDRGISTCLASNGCAGNGGQSMFAAMKDGAGITKSLSGRPDRFGVEQVLAMATIDAARALGIDDRTGSLEVGKDADLVLVRMGGIHQAPMVNPLAALVYSSRGADVSDVFVRGRHVVRDGVLQTADTDELVSRSRSRALRLLEA